MSNLDLEQTQPSSPVEEAQSPSVEETQPKNGKPKPRRGLKVLLALFGVIFALLLGAWAGYQSGLGARMVARQNQVTQGLLEQFQLALVDIQFQRYEVARQRLEYILSIDPNFPMAQQKLAEVLVQMSIPTATPSPTVTPTADLSEVTELFQRAQTYIAAQDWTNALTTLDALRKRDPNFHTPEVDGMYYLALISQGKQYIQQGNLETGIYYLTLAERFGPLDRDANALREGARLYITAASFWEIDWEQAYTLFGQLASGFPGLTDGTMSATQRFYIAAMRYGDVLFGRGDYCGAWSAYQAAMQYGQLEKQSKKNAEQAYITCYPPTPTPDILPTDTPTP
ncbi:MAG: hypothetical protein WHS87_01665 [Anaerolineales bacterium]